MSFEIDLEHGGRWTGLTLAGREWLWSRPDPARNQVRPGDGFVDAGGIEECLPTIRGLPDHGAVWSRPWTALSDGLAAVETDDFWFARRIHQGEDGAVRASYRLHAAAGYRFVWAAHALLDLSENAEVCLPTGLPVRLYDQRGRSGPSSSASCSSTGTRLDLRARRRRGITRTLTSAGMSEAGTRRILPHRPSRRQTRRRRLRRPALAWPAPLCHPPHP